MATRETDEQAIAAPRELKSLAPRGAEQRAAAGTRSRPELARIGPAGALFRLRDCGFSPSLNLAGTIDGARQGTPTPAEENSRIVLEHDRPPEARARRPARRETRRSG